MNTRILETLAEYSQDQKEFETLGRVGGANKLDHRRARYLSLETKLSRASFPPPGVVVAACLAEVQQLASEAQRLLNEWRQALQAELETRKVWAAAEATLQYEGRFHILGIDAQAARDEARKARGAFDVATAKSRDVEVARRRVFDYAAEEYPAASDLKNPQAFEAAAQQRVERILGGYYGQPEPIIQRWGVT